jgi:hypothetical protein
MLQSISSLQHAETESCDKDQRAQIRAPCGSGNYRTGVKTYGIGLLIDVAVDGNSLSAVTAS